MCKSILSACMDVDAWCPQRPDKGVGSWDWSYGCHGASRYWELRPDPLQGGPFLARVSAPLQALF